MNIDKVILITGASSGIGEAIGGPVEEPPKMTSSVNLSF